MYNWKIPNTVFKRLFYNKDKSYYYLISILHLF